MDEEAKRKALLKLATQKPEIAENFSQEGLDKMMEMLGRPAAATRSAIQAYQTGESNPFESFKKQLMKPSSEAPSGADIAETFGEKHDIQNPYALAALATLSDVADPLALIPGEKMAMLPGIVGKIEKVKDAEKGLQAVKGMGKLERNLSQVGDISFPAENEAKFLKIKKALEQTGKVPEGTVGTYGSRQPIQMQESILNQPSPVNIPPIKRETSARQELLPEELQSILQQFPQINPDKRLLQMKKPR